MLKVMRLQAILSLITYIREPVVGAISKLDDVVGAGGFGMSIG